MGTDPVATGGAGTSSPVDEAAAGATTVNPAAGGAATGGVSATGGVVEIDTGLVPEYFDLTSAGAIELVGAERIYRCPLDTGEPTSDSLPHFSFRQFTDAELAAWLQSAPEQLVPGALQDVTPVDGGSELSIDFGTGVAWIDKTTGAFSSSSSVDTAAERTVAELGGAVDAALDQLSAASLWTAAPKEQLCVSATSTAFSIVTSGGEPSVTQYSIVLHRSYEGVPLFGPGVTLSVSSRGQIELIVSGWRTIDATTERPLAILTYDELQAARNAEWVTGLALNFVQCGYFESTEYEVMAAPAVGCHYQYDDPTAGGEMLAPVRDEWVNLSVTGLPPLPAP